MQLYLNPYYLTLQGELYKYPGYIMLIIHFYFTCYCFFLCFYHGILRRERDYSSAFCGFMRKVRTLACASVRIRFYGYIGGVFFSLPLAGKAAEREGFEPSIRFWRIHTFQACAFDHSAISPEYQGAKILKNPIITMLIQCNFTSNGSMQVIYNCFTACTLSQ